MVACKVWVRTSLIIGLMPRFERDLLSFLPMDVSQNFSDGLTMELLSWQAETGKLTHNTRNVWEYCIWDIKQHPDQLCMWGVELFAVLFGPYTCTIANKRWQRVDVFEAKPSQRSINQGIIWYGKVSSVRIMVHVFAQNLVQWVLDMCYTCFLI